ncbi:MAG: SDR family oxidoreductase [Planctomycetes bacterium]|nr:SDR family oxidoreductase [Planctomycetota bacterium]
MAALKQTLKIAAGGLAALLAGRAVARALRTYDFRDRVVLVTGGSRGLGLVLARELVDRGARVAICARDTAELERAADDLRQRGGDVLTFPCDVTDRDAVFRMIGRIADHWGPLDVLINNAGIIQFAPLVTMTPADFDEAIKTHLDGPRNTIEAALPDMLRRGAGRIVNIASIGGRIAVPHLVPYCASKFALVGYSQGLRCELAQRGIVVTTICPGLMRTGSPRNATFKGRHREEYAWFKISDSLPILSMNAERAARKILRACERGDALVVLGVPAKLADVFYSLFPGLSADLYALAGRLLPAPGGIGTGRARDYESESTWSQSLLTRLTDRAAVQNNET